jgi:hypothetical protein
MSGDPRSAATSRNPDVAITVFTDGEAHGERVNYGETVLLVISGWALLSVAVAATVGGMARAHRVDDAIPKRRAG